MTGEPSTTTCRSRGSRSTSSSTEAARTQRLSANCVGCIAVMTGRYPAGNPTRSVKRVTVIVQLSGPVARSRQRCDPAGQEPLARHALGDAFTVEVRRDATEVEGEVAADEQREVDVTGVIDHALVEHQPDLQRQRGQRGFADLLGAGLDKCLGAIRERVDVRV